MSDNFLQHLVDNLSAKQVGELITDTNLRKHGATLSVFIDPHDIYNFCFPIRPDKVTDIDLDAIGSHQLAVYEAVYRWESRALITREYLREIEGVLKYAETFSNEVYKRSEMVDAMLVAANYDEESFGKLVKERGVSDALMSRSFRYLLSVRLGFHRHAIERLTDVYERRIDKTFPSGVPECLRDVDQAYEEGAYGDTRFQAMVELLWSVVPKWRRKGAQRSQTEKSIIADVKLIDKLFVLNAESERLHQAGEIPRHVFLYLSSAARTKAIFSDPRFAGQLPIVAGKPFGFWRTNMQWFVLAVKRAEHARGGTLDQTTDALEDLRNLLTEIHFKGLANHSKKRCKACYLDGRVPDDCEFDGLCQRLEDFRRAAENCVEKMTTVELGSKVGTYRELSSTTAAPLEGRYGTFIKAFETLQSNRDLLIERALTLHRAIHTSSSFVGEVPESAKNIFSTVAHLGKLDPVTASSQFFPRRPVFEKDQYSVLWKSLLGAFDRRSSGLMRSTGAVGGPRQDVIEVYEKFLILDARHVGEESSDHELARCLLYLSFCTSEHSAKAFEHAKHCVELFPEQAVEFLYVAIWAGRRSNNYEVTDVMAKDAIEEFPMDARLYHGRQLNLFSWLRQEDDRQLKATRLAECVELTKKALKLFLGEEPQDRVAIAANLNNLAFLLSFDESFERCFDLKAARGYLETLREKYFPKDDWNPLHPEYHHTEAHLELQEAIQALRGGDQLRAAEIIKDAFREAYRAKSVFPDKPEHIATYDAIVHFAATNGFELPVVGS